MAENLIDLIPAEERIKRTKEKAQKFALIFSTILIFLAATGSVVIYYYVKNIDDQIATTTDNINQIKAKISQKSAIEIAARNLDVKFNSISSVLSDKIYHSKLLTELSSRVPTTVSLGSIDSSTPETILVSGTATDYVSLAKFLNSLYDPSSATASATMQNKQNMFTQVVINAVTLDPLNYSARFGLSITVDTNQLKGN